MAYCVTPNIGADLTNTITAAEVTAGSNSKLFNLGEQVFGSDGKLYVFGKANASISASTAVCTVNATTFLVTASGGAYTSPATAMSSGDFGWFSKASV